MTSENIKKKQETEKVEKVESSNASQSKESKEKTIEEKLKDSEEKVDQLTGVCSFMAPTNIFITACLSSAESINFPPLQYRAL